MKFHQLVQQLLQPGSKPALSMIEVHIIMDIPVTPGLEAPVRYLQIAAGGNW